MKKQQLGRLKNKLLRYKLVMEEFEKHDSHLIPITTIHKRFIYPKFFISRDTLYKIFNTDIDTELQKVTEVEKRLTNRS